MIPKTIHYCWFGGKPLPESARKCVDSWRKFFPDYEIKQWDESNYDVRKIPYIAEAYDAGKYAFVSDFARFDIIHRHGGVYFDTDVEAIAPFTDILARGAFMGAEINGTDTETPVVAAGLGIAAEAGHPVYAEIIDYYATHHLRRADGTLDTTYAVVRITTDILRAHGLRATADKQEVAGITIYPADFFNPFDDATGRLRKTANTRSVHWFSKTWLDVSPMRMRLSRLFHRLFGVNALARLRRK